MQPSKPALTFTADLPRAIRKMSRLLDGQLKDIQRLVEDGSPAALLRSRLAALLECQIEDRQNRMELLLRTTQLLRDLDQTADAGSRRTPVRELHSVRRRWNRGSAVYQGRLA